MITADTADYPEKLQPYKELLANRSMLVRKMNVIPVECIARGYLIGSGWKEYQSSGTIGGLPLRDGYTMADKLDEPIFTPSTKAEQGLHDENISYEKMRDIVGSEMAAKLKEKTLAIYNEAATFALGKGIIIADTKFEFGVQDGELFLIDEVLTPDSSRFWPANEYKPGSSPLSFDKQYVRDYLETLDWDKTPPAPELPAEIVRKTTEKYREAYRLITGKILD
jgi:phosphoribosylaminoimidazole-succinocarboxamide synthase